MAKRGNNEGTIYKRNDGRWTAAVSLENGRRRYLYGKTRQEVSGKLNKALHEKELGIPVPSERQTVEQFLRQWLDTIRPTLEDSTFTRYEQYVRLHTVPHIGKVRLARVTPQHLQRLYAQKLEEGLSPTTVNHLHACIHRALAHAVQWELIARNVADQVDPPKNAYYDAQPLTADEAKQLLAASRGERFEALYVIALTTGMRQGELLGLHWSEIDLDQGLLYVRKALKRGGFVKDPKSSKHRRAIILTPIGIDALRKHRVQQNEERLQVGPAWNDVGLVFANKIGSIVDTDNLRHRDFPRLLKKADLRRVRFHDLRHSTATLLLSLGIHPKIVQEILGHSNISVTMDVYSHALPTLQRDAMESLNKLLVT